MLIRPTEEQFTNFGEPDFIIYNAGQFPANRFTKGMSSTTSVEINFKRMEMVILGTEYAGEMKKGVFSVMVYFYQTSSAIFHSHHLSSITFNPSNSVNSLSTPRPMWALRRVMLLSFSVFPVPARPHSPLILTAFSSVTTNMSGRTLVSLTLRADVTPSASISLPRRNLTFSTPSNLAASLRMSCTALFPEFLIMTMSALLRTLVAPILLSLSPTLKSLVLSTVNPPTSSC